MSKKNNFFKSIVNDKRNLKIFIAGLCSLIALIIVIVILARPIVYNKDYSTTNMGESIYFYESGIKKELVKIDNTEVAYFNYYFIKDGAIYSSGNNPYKCYDILSFCSIKSVSSDGHSITYTCWYAIYILIVWLVIFIVSICFLIHFIKNKRKNLAVIEDNQDEILTKTNVN